MVRVFAILCGIVMMGLLMGCKNTDSGSQTSVVTAADLMHHRYEIVSFNDAPVEVAGDVAIELSFGENMHISGKACNRFSGQSSITNGVLKAPHLAATKMFCADELSNSLESTLFAMFGKGVSVSLDGEKLILKDGDNTIVYTRRDLMQ